MIDQVGTNQEHQTVTEMLPWFVNNSLTETETKQVENHLQHCQDCRQQIGILRAIDLKGDFLKTPGAVRWTLAAESLALAALVLVLVMPQMHLANTVPGEYQTLSDADSVSS